CFIVHYIADIMLVVSISFHSQLDTAQSHLRGKPKLRSLLDKIGLVSFLTEQLNSDYYGLIGEIIVKREKLATRKRCLLDTTEIFYELTAIVPT
ncbi:hypothetical protein STEG23_021198, partial [Scotinomys teguina]